MLVYVEGDTEPAIGELENIQIVRTPAGERALGVKLQGRADPVVVIPDEEDTDAAMRFALRYLAKYELRLRLAASLGASTAREAIMHTCSDVGLGTNDDSVFGLIQNCVLPIIGPHFPKKL